MELTMQNKFEMSDNINAILEMMSYFIFVETRKCWGERQ